MYAIEAQNLTKAYKNRTAVKSLSLTVNDGEMFALLGQNGAGKTTTIKMLTGLTTPTSGDALIFGKSIVKDCIDAKKMINVSPQETAVANKLTVKENLEFSAQIYGEDKRKARELAEEYMKSFDLTERASDKARTLSGGMQRRLSIAMAMISKPKILFLDEPTLGLDVMARRKLRKHIEPLKGKVTVILTTHYLEEAEALADRIAIMDEGVIKAVGTAEELKQMTKKESLEDAFVSLCAGEEDI